ncbi:MAG: hypothetical protein ACR2JX_03645 [Mycobacteriales bacterium]
MPSDGVNVALDRATGLFGAVIATAIGVVAGGGRGVLPTAQRPSPEAAPS